MTGALFIITMIAVAFVFYIVGVISGVWAMGKFLDDYRAKKEGRK